MEAIEARGCTLVLVDYQERLLPAIHGGDAALSRALLLADVARELGIRVVGTEQNPAGLGPNVAAIRARCEATLAKDRFDGCADGLLAYLGGADAAAAPHVVVAGCEAHVCLMQTALGLLRAGLRVWVVADACGSRSPGDHALAIERLRQAGAGVVSAEMVVFEWLGTCRHERFRAVLRRLKE